MKKLYELPENQNIKLYFDDTAFSETTIFSLCNV